MIRKRYELTSDELEAVLKIWLEVNVDTHNYIDRKYWADNYEYVKSALTNATIYLYVINEKVVGFLGMTDSYIEGVFLEKSFRKRGIGKALLAESKKENKHLTVSVYKKNKQAVRFYQSQAFAIMQEQVETETKEVEYVMQWERKAE